MQWYVQSGEREVEGPLGEEAIIAALTQRVVSRRARINLLGSPEWVPIQSHAAFADAVRRIDQPTQRPERAVRLSRPLPRLEAHFEENTRPLPLVSEVAAPSPPTVEAKAPDEPKAPGGAKAPVEAREAPGGPRWLLPLAAAATTLLVAIAASGWASFAVARDQLRELGERQAELSAKLDGVRAEIAAGRAVKHVEMKQLAHQCASGNGHATCTFTNLGDEPLSTCFRAKLSLRSAPGVQLESLAACTGRIAPRATVAVSAPWLRGEASDVCKSKGPFGERLDWAVCEAEYVTAARATE